MPEETVLEAPPTPEAQEEAITAVQAAFERAAPLKGKKAKAEKPKEEPPKPAEPEKIEPAKELEPIKEEMKLPSFITSDKPKEEVKAEPEIKLEDLPKEAPEGSDEKTKINWKKTRTLIEKQDTELRALRAKQDEKQEAGKELSQVDTARLKQLEDENKGMREQFQRLGLQHHPKFIQEVIQPLQNTYARAKRIIKDAGGNPEMLDKALSSSGQSHYTAMDEVLADLPESAKGELNATMAEYRKYVESRNAALSNAPKAFEELQRQDVINQKQEVENHISEMGKLFDERLRVMRDTVKFEPLIETTEESSKWWNDIPKNVIATARKIALENNDPAIVMDASILAAAAPTLRDLWLKAETRATKAEKELAEVKGAEPTISDAGSHTAITQDEELRKLPIGQAFVKILQQQE